MAERPPHIPVDLWEKLPPHIQEQDIPPWITPEKFPAFFGLPPDPGWKRFRDNYHLTPEQRRELDKNSRGGRGKSKYKAAAHPRADEIKSEHPDYSAPRIAGMIIREKKISGLPGDERLARAIQKHWRDQKPEEPTEAIALALQDPAYGHLRRFYSQPPKK